MPQTPPPADLICHRFFVPMALQAATGAKNLAGQAEMKVVPQIGNFPCIKAACMLWNSDRSECFDKTQARALDRIKDNYAVPHGAQ